MDELIYYCKESEPTGALMLTGEWGCGKTHLIEHELSKELEKTHIVVRVSLFGIDSIDALNAAVKKEWIKACGGFLSKFQDHEKSLAVGRAIFGTVGAIAGSFLPVIKDATDAALAINPLMYPNPEIEKLRKQQEQGQKKLEQLQHREQQLQNRIHYLEGAERRQRNHRLITRGAAVEHLWPEVKALSEQDFYSLMELVLSLNVARKVLHSFLQSRPKEDDE